MTSLRDITGATVFDAIKGRRSVRSYTQEALSEETVRSLLRAAVLAPTAMHEEPWGFVVIQVRTLLKRYSDSAKAMMLERPEFRHLPVLSDPAYDIFHGAGTLIVVCGRTRGRFVEADCWLAAQNLMLSAHAHGLGTCCIGLAVELFNRPQVKAELGIPVDGSAVAPIVAGTPRAHVPAVPRKAPEVLRWIKP